MHRQGQSADSFFRTMLLIAIAILMVAVVAIPAFTQNSVPPTAVQATKMPRYAPRLAHPVKRLLPPAASAQQRAKMRPEPLQGNDIYDNGPINGNTDAWTINFGYIVSDSFRIASSNQTPVTGMSFGAWLFSGDTLTSAELSITSGENGGTSYFDQTVSFTQGSCTTNQYGYNICTETGSFNGPTLNAGTYWVNLQNASVPSGDPVYWDENSGVGCTGQGCPSLASQDSVGSIPSESFTILGSATTTTSSTYTYSDYACPSPQPGFHDLHEYSSNAGPSGLVADTAGKVYGTFATGGSYGAGVLYGLAQKAGHWFLNSLYSFLGGSNGGNPDGVIVGPGGALYGSAGGGSNGYGLVYKATPPPNACSNALCSWNVSTIYNFTSSTGFGTVTAFDSGGNLYGISFGGLYGQGAVFELSPSGGGWTEQTLYSFTGGADGGGPNSLLLGHDGNLYGTAAGGGNNDCVDGYTPCGVVFQLVRSGGGWTENVLYSFTGGVEDGYSPGGLIQDSRGTLYGFSICYYDNSCYFEGDFIQFGLVFAMSQSGSGWSFQGIYDAGLDQRACTANPWGISSNLVYGLTLDAADNLYAAEGGVLEFCNAGNCNEWVELYCGQIANVGSGEVLVTGDANIFGNVTADANGKLYGTTSTCGFGSPQRNTGMIWQYSP